MRYQSFLSSSTWIKPWCTGLFLGWNLIGYIIICAQPNRKSILAYPMKMADQCGLKPEDYIKDLKSLSYQYYIQDMLFIDPSLSKQLLKPFVVIATIVMIYDIIYLGKWDFPFMKADPTYLLCCMCFTVMEHFYSYRKSKHRCYCLTDGPSYSVSLVSSKR